MHYRDVKLSQQSIKSVQSKRYKGNAITQLCLVEIFSCLLKLDLNDLDFYGGNVLGKNSIWRSLSAYSLWRNFEPNFKDTRTTKIAQKLTEL